MPVWDAELEDLSMHGKQHSPSSGMGETDYLGCLLVRSSTACPAGIRMHPDLDGAAYCL